MMVGKLAANIGVLSRLISSFRMLDGTIVEWYNLTFRIYFQGVNVVGLKSFKVV